MLVRFSYRALLAVSVLAGSIALGQSQDAAKFDPEGCAKAVAPFVEAETFAVAHVNLAKVSQESLDKLYEVIPFVPNQPRSPKEEFLKPFQVLQQAGCKDVYFVASHYNQEPLLKHRILGVIPVSKSAEDTIRSLIPKPQQKGLQRIGDALVFSMTDKAPTSLKPVERPELKSAFEAAGDTTVQVALIPPASTRRVIEELVPELPKEIGGGATSVFTNGVQWASLGIELPPHFKAGLTVQSKDAKAAEALQAKLVELMQLAGKYEKVRAAMPEYDEIAKLLSPKIEKDRLLLTLDQKEQKVSELMGNLLSVQVRTAQVAAQKAQSSNNLKQIALGMLNYESAHATYPAQANVDNNGKPLLSWRVHILPYLERMDLYNQFHLDEPWDSEHNRTLINKMPTVYRSPLSKNAVETGLTNYLVPCGQGTVFEEFKPTKISDIKDGTSSTILTLEADDDQAVIWTKPEDWNYDASSPMKGLGQISAPSRTVQTAFCDGSVHVISLVIEPKDFCHLIEKADGYAIDCNKIHASR